MKYRWIALTLTLVSSAMACGLPGLAATATVRPLPPTPNLPTLAPAAPTDTAPPPVPPTETATAIGFGGTWQGPDPDDGSFMVLTLVQSGNALTGTYEDSFSASVPPPGYMGSVTGTILSPSTGQITMQLARHDGKDLVLQANLTLTSEPNTLRVDLISVAAGPWVLTRQ